MQIFSLGLKNELRMQMFFELLLKEMDNKISLWNSLEVEVTFFYRPSHLFNCKLPSGARINGVKVNGEYFCFLLSKIAFRRGQK